MPRKIKKLPVEIMAESDTSRSRANTEKINEIIDYINSNHDQLQKQKQIESFNNFQETAKAQFMPHTVATCKDPTDTLTKGRRYQLQFLERNHVRVQNDKQQIITVFSNRFTLPRIEGIPIIVQTRDGQPLQVTGMQAKSGVVIIKL